MIAIVGGMARTLAVGSRSRRCACATRSSRCRSPRRRWRARSRAAVGRAGPTAIARRSRSTSWRPCCCSSAASGRRRRCSATRSCTGRRTAWLMQLPLFSDAVRAPASFAMPAMLALSVAAALAFDRLALSPRVRRVLALVLAGAIVADGSVRALPLPPIPTLWPGSDRGRVSGARVAGRAMPVTTRPRCIAPRCTAGRSVNGLSGFDPLHYVVLRLASNSGDATALEALAEHGPLLIAVDDAPTPHALAGFRHGASWRATRVAATNAGRCFVSPAAPRRRRAPTARRWRSPARPTIAAGRRRRAHRRRSAHRLDSGRGAVRRRNADARSRPSSPRVGGDRAAGAPASLPALGDRRDVAGRHDWKPGSPAEPAAARFVRARRIRATRRIEFRWGLASRASSGSGSSGRTPNMPVDRSRERQRAETE